MQSQISPVITGAAAPSSGIRLVPAGTGWSLQNFEPALESMAEFLHRTSSERFPSKFSGVGICAIRTVPSERNGIGLPEGAMLVIDSCRRSTPGALSLLGLRDGRILLREFQPEGAASASGAWSLRAEEIFSGAVPPIRAG